jgi:hypothetical protein
LSLISGTALLSGGFPDLARLSLWLEQHVDEDELHNIDGMIPTGETEVLREKPYTESVVDE